MKLRIESRGSISVLVATDQIGMQHAAVLKAGLNRLIRSGKHQILLDFSAYNEAELKDPELISELNALIPWGLLSNAYVGFISKIPGLGYKSVEEAIARGAVEPRDVFRQQEIIEQYVNRLKAQKTEVESELKAVATDNSEIKKLRKENSDLKRTVENLEALVTHVLKSRRAPEQSLKDPYKQKRTALYDLIVETLQGQNIMQLS